MKTLSHSTFLKQYKSFIEENYGNAISSDRCIKWFEAVENAHKDIREIIGDISCLKSFDIKDINLPLNCNNVWLQAVLKQLPAYLKTYEFTVEDLLLPKIAKFKNISTTKHMKTYAKKVFDQFILPNVLYNIDMLASIYGNNKIPGGKYIVELRTDAMSFARLGHYGHDSTCFANDGQNWSHKYKIGIKENSFVILIHKDKEVVARCWGFVDIKKDIWHTLNHYCYQISSGTMQYLLERFFDRISVYGSTSTNVGIYINPLPMNNLGHVLSFVKTKQENSNLIKVTLPKYSTKVEGIV